MNFSNFVETLENKWGTGLLGENFELKNGINFSAAQKGQGILTLDVKNMFGGGTFINSSELYRVDTSPKSERILKNGDILFVRSSVKKEGVGWASAFQEVDEPVSFCGFLIRARPLNDDFDPNFLVYYLRQPLVRDRLVSHAGQVAITNISQATLSKLPIPIPPIAEQKRIAAILDAADALRVKRREAIAQLDTLLQSTFLEMFGDPVENPMNWETCKFEELIVEGPQNGLYKPSKDYGEGTRILRIDGFYRGIVNEQSSLKRVRITDKERDLYSLSESDVVINRVNSREYLGKCAIIPPLNEEVVFESNMMRLKVDTSLVLPRFTVEFLQTKFIKHQILRASKDAVNQSSINQKDIKSFKFLKPPLELQEKFIRVAHLIERQKAQQRQHLSELDILFASLQSRAFNGEL